MRFSLRDVATYYSGQVHQDDALDFLEHHTCPGIAEQFCDRWQFGRKNVIPSHISWREKLKLLLEADEELPKSLDVESVYLLFAELLIQQSATANPEYASRLLDLISPKKKKRDYNWMD